MLIINMRNLFFILVIRCDLPVFFYASVNFRLSSLLLLFHRLLLVVLHCVEQLFGLFLLLIFLLLILRFLLRLLIGIFLLVAFALIVFLIFGVLVLILILLVFVALALLLVLTLLTSTLFLLLLLILLLLIVLSTTILLVLLLLIFCSLQHLHGIAQVVFCLFVFGVNLERLLVVAHGFFEILHAVVLRVALTRLSGLFLFQSGLQLTVAHIVMNLAFL